VKKVKLSFKNKVLIPIIAIFVIAVLVISLNAYRLMDLSVRTRTRVLLDRFTADIHMQIENLDIIFETSNNVLRENHLSLAKAISHILQKDEAFLSTEYLKSLSSLLGIVEINIASPEGFVIHSNYAEYIGFNYNSNPRTSEYLALLDGTKTVIHEEPRRSISDAPSITVVCHYIGIALDDGGFLQVGYNPSTLLLLEGDINIERIIRDSTIGESGYGIVMIAGRVFAHPNVDLMGRNLFIEDWHREVRSGDGFAWINIEGAVYFAGYINRGSHTIVGLIPEAEYYRELNQMRTNTILFVSIATAIMILVILITLQQLLKPINELKEGIEEIAKGDFEGRIEGNYNDEFEIIKDAVNNMAESVISHLNDKLRAEQAVYEAKLHELDLKMQVYNDSLTGIYNRRYLDENLDRIVKSLSRSDSMLSLLMVDIDCFKPYNDTYGHSAGDECLRVVANVLNDNITRQEDFVLRYGGEEFCVVLPNTDEKGAALVAERLLESISSLNILHEGSTVAHYLTISIGGTTGNATHTQKGEDFIKRADSALYESKTSGRNRYTSFPMS